MPKKKKKGGGGGKKKGGGGPSRKSEERMKKAMIEDRTFGMKNKKGKKQQKMIATIKNQINSRGSGKQNKGGVRALESEAYEKKKAKKKKEKAAAQMAKLLGIAKDEAKILAGVKKKKKKKKKKATEGDALRATGNAEAGAVSDRQAARRRLRKQRKKQKLADIDLEDLMYEEETPIEEIIEQERKELIESGKPLTPVTLENFLEWKRKKKKTKDAKAIKAKDISGRLLFETNADKYNVDDAGAAGEGEYDEVRTAEEAAAATAAAPLKEEEEEAAAAAVAAAVPAAAAAVFLDEGLDDLDDVDFDDDE